MPVTDKLFEIPQFSLGKADKEAILLDHLTWLHEHHYGNNTEYRNISDRLFGGNIEKISEMPFLPVGLFKKYALKSIPEKSVYKVLTSSGTTGQIPSRIILDKHTAKFQSKALAKIITHVVGQERLPMLLVDSQKVIKDRNSFSARGAGILGLSLFGKNHHYLLDDAMNVNFEVMRSFIEKYNGKPVLIFGFTFMVWLYLYQTEFGRTIDLSNAILIHSGGWKKLREQAVDNKTFKSKLEKKFGLKRIYNFYGMVEQVGSVFLENSDGFLHCPNFSDIIIRNPVDFSVMPQGEKGLIQVVSTLPESYPGHSILTDDIGICMGEDDASNGWKGKYFQVLGRVEKAELRGCSDTFAASQSQ